LIKALLDALGRVILGKERLLEDALTAILARGHLLLEDLPGVGKTTLARALAQLLGCQFKRIQFTSDLLPSDILGVNIYSRQSEQFRFCPGPIFSHIVLADEINRTTPKTQSSLLEAMNEGQVSIDDETRPLPRPFVVIATQNPQDYHGTYPLPEGQLDRFLMRLRLGYPHGDQERQILRNNGAANALLNLKPLLNPERLLELQEQASAVRVSEPVLDYIMALVEETRKMPQLRLGISTRGALALQAAARARAFVLGRGYVLPDDAKYLAVPVLAHRIQLAGVSSLLRPPKEAEQLIRRLLETLPVPL